MTTPITVTVRLFATLRQYHPQGAPAAPITMQVEEGTTVGQIVQRLDIPREAVRVVFVNGVAVDDAARVKDGDEVGIFPPLAGGCTVFTAPR